MTPVTQAIALALLAIAACRPSTIAEAERRGDVPWLEENGTPDAVAALGRLADKDPKALAALESRSSFDVQAFKVAWAAALRGSPWGAPLLRGALADPKRADFAASGMGRHVPALLPFVGDLENALVRVAASTRNVNIATALASVGPEARTAVERRLTEPSTRGAMCRGIASKESDADARSALRVVPEAARDDPACVEAAVRVAADEDATLAWMAERAEPGILGAAGKGDSMPCARLHVAWNKALGARTSDAYPALTVPLAYAIKRCPAEMDGILADAIVHLPAARGVVVQAIDPFGDYGAALRATCAALPVVAGGHDAAILRERAADALQHACVKSG